jgi:serine/threonine-protein kinase
LSSVLKICPVCSTEYPANERFCPRDGSALRSQGAEPNDLVGSIIADRYHVIRKLGEGGMGQVYLAEHVKMGRKSAVKVMNPGMVQNVDAISRFNREASNASRINHPNVAGIYDFGETPDGLIYLAMEFVEGEPLTEIINRHGALVASRASEIARQIAEGLSVAHEMGIVHRDLKPDNIMVAKARSGADLVKVVDFGIAKAAASDNQKVTKTGMVIGTPEYMSPEQLSGDPVDARSDIYSLGLVTFNMLTGKLPFPSDSMQETMIMRLTDKPKDLAEMRPEIAWPADIQRVMDRVLERDVELRYAHSSDFARDLVESVERMPSSVAAAAGTQLVDGAVLAGAADQTLATVALGAIPKTRVSPQGQAQVVGRTAEDLSRRKGQSATVAESAAAGSSPARNPARARNVLIAGVGAVLVAGAAVFSFLPHGPGDGATGNGSAPPASLAGTQAGNGGTDAGGAGTQAQPPQTSTQDGGAKSATPQGSPSPVPDRGATKHTPPKPEPARIIVADSLTALEQLWQTSDDSLTARHMLARAAALNPTTDEERVRYALIVANANLTLDSLPAACNALRKVEGIAGNTSMSSKVSALLSAGCE